MKISKLFVSLVMLTAGAAQLSASTIILTPNVGSLEASIFTDLTTFAFYDVRGAAGGVLGSTQVFMSDSTNGTDPNFLTLPFGNLTVNSFTGDLLNIATLTFSDVNPIINGDILTLSLTGAFGTNGDGSLVPFTAGPLTADFLFTGQDDLGGGQYIFRYSLQSISDVNGEVPEPGTLALIGAAVPIVLLLRRRKRAL